MANENEGGKRMEVFIDTDTNQEVVLPVSEKTQVVTPPQPKPNVAKVAGRPAPDPTISSDINILEEPIVPVETEDDDDAGSQGSFMEELETDGAKPKVAKKKAGSDPSSEAGSSSSSLPYSAFAKALNEEGVISQFDADDFNTRVQELGSPGAALVSLVKETVEDSVEAYKQSLTPEQQDYLNMIEAGIPHGRAVAFQSMEDEIASIKSDDIDSDDELASSLVTRALALRGYSKEDIDDQIDTYTKAGKLKANAKKDLEFLKKYSVDAKKQELQKADANRQAQANSAKQFADSVRGTLEKTTELFGQKLNNKLKAKIYQSITTPVVIDRSTGMQLNIIGKKRMENTVDFDIKLAAAIQLGLFDGSLSKVIAAGGRTNAISELDDLFTQNGGSNGSGGKRPAMATQGDGKVKAKDILASMGRLNKSRNGR